MSRFDVDSRRDFDQLHAVASAPEHAALGDVEHRLPGFGRIGAVEGDLLDRWMNFFGFALAQDLELAVLDLDFESAGGEGARKRARGGRSG